MTKAQRRRAVGIGIPRRSPPSAPTRAVVDTLVDLVTTSGPDHANIVPTTQVIDDEP